MANTKGKGRVYKGNTLIVDVDYSINDVKDLKSGITRSTGRIIVSQDQANSLVAHLSGRNILTLHLADGRKRNFYLRVIEPNQAAVQKTPFEIQPTGVYY